MGRGLLVSSFQGATPKILYSIRYLQDEGGRKCGVGGEIRLFRCYELLIAHGFT